MPAGSCAGTISTALVVLLATSGLPFAVEDFPARRGDRQCAGVVGVGLLDVAFASQDLQVPEAEEDHAEHHHRDAAEDRHAQRPAAGRRATRGSRGRTGSIALMRRDSGLSPPVVYAPAPATAARVLGQRALERPAHERPHRQRHDGVDDHAEHDLAQQVEADGRVDAEHELDRASSRPATSAAAIAPTSSGVSAACGSRTSRRRPAQ